MVCFYRRGAPELHEDGTGSFGRFFPGADADVDVMLVHTGQHYDARMSEVFMEELGLPPASGSRSARAFRGADCARDGRCGTCAHRATTGTSSWCQAMSIPPSPRLSRP